VKSLAPACAENGHTRSRYQPTTQRGRTNNAMQLAADQKRTRGELAAERIREGKTLAALQVEKPP